MLRGNFEGVLGSLTVLTPYIFISVGCALLVFLVAGLDRTPWRYSSVGDHLHVVILTLLAILLALVLTFALNRLEPVARSLPVAQGTLIVTFLVSARGAARFWYARQIHFSGNGYGNGRPQETVLVMGVSAVAELYLLSVQEFASQLVRVAGILADEPSMRGRTIQQKPVLGTIEELHEILQSLEIHGVAVDRIVVAIPSDRLRPHALDSLLDVEKTSNIVVDFLSERLGFEGVSPRPQLLSEQKRNGVAGQRAVGRVANVIDRDHPNSTGYSRLGKRVFDVVVAIFLMVTLTPVLVLVAFIVGLDVGFPVIFWQQRPGLDGRPFKLYKFRTMRPPHDKRKRRIPDDQRSSAIGQLIRRIRFDELPQLYNVLVGNMSLVGPRPLLPRDQSPDYVARLSVRPGITGWAQVNGGRIISCSDKCLLDIWYAQNLSFTLDFKIVLSTVKMVVFGDRINIEAVNQARSDLGLKTLLRTKMVPAE
jgi:lipopolysaccharide/colanic/teichoic acid biosynthesis glycosyltransferase